MATLKYKNGSSWVSYTGWTSLETNVTQGKANDVNTFWRDHDAGIYYFSENNQIVDQPSTYGFLINIKPNNTTGFAVQLWIAYDGSATNTGSQIWTRTTNINASVSVFTSWRKYTTWSDIYPVGAVYISYVSTSPASLFGGSWTKIENKVLRAANDVSTGGSDTSTHFHMGMSGASEGNIYHAAYSAMKGVSITNSNLLPNPQTYPSNTINYTRANTSVSTYYGTAKTDVVRTDYTTQVSLSNLPAYQNLYVWRRTA